MGFIAGGQRERMIASAGFVSESVDIADGELESFGDPLRRFLPDVAFRGIRLDGVRRVFCRVSFAVIAARGAIPEGVEISGADVDVVATRIAFGLRFQETGDAVKRLMNVAFNMFEPGQKIDGIGGAGGGHIGFRSDEGDDAVQLGKGMRGRLVPRFGSVGSVRRVVVVPGGVASHVGKAGEQLRRRRVGASLIVESGIALDLVGPHGGGDEGGASACDRTGGRVTEK